MSSPNSSIQSVLVGKLSVKKAVDQMSRQFKDAVKGVSDQLKSPKKSKS